MNDPTNTLEHKALALHSEKVFPQPVHPHLFSCCPTRDLLAVVTKDEQLDVYRYGEQRTFGLKRKRPDLRVSCIRWKYDGKSILVAWSDGSIDQVYADPRQHRLMSSPGICPLTYLAWGINLISPSTHKPDAYAAGYELEQALHDLSLEDILDQDILSESRHAIASLPDLLKSFDVQSELPKLSAVPMYAGIPNSEQSESFTSQESVDAAFHRSRVQKPPVVDIILACQDSGVISRKMYEFMDLDALQNPLDRAFHKHRVVAHSSHPYSSTHALITTAGARKESLQTSESGSLTGVLALLPLNLLMTLDLGLGLTSAMEDIEQWCLSLKSYIVRSVYSIKAAFQQARALPSRYMDNINETLSDRNQGNVVEALYHLAVTGNCPGGIKDWLVDEVGLRGHQRWDQAVTSGLSDVVRITHENLLPALERCSVVASRFNGLSKHPRASFLLADIPESQSLDSMLVVLDCMRLIGYTILVYATRELRQFTVFSGWLRDQTELHKDGAEDAETDEAAEKAASVDYEQLLAYIEGPMMHSRLQDLLDEPSTDVADTYRHTGDMPTVRQRCIQALGHHKQGLQCDRTYCAILVYLHFLQDRLNAIGAHVSGKLGDTAWFDPVVILEREEVTSAMDARMILEDTSGQPRVVTYVAAVTKGAIHQVNVHVVTNTSEPLAEGKHIHVELGDGEVKDLRFADDHEITVLLRKKDSSALLSLRYRESHSKIDDEIIGTWEHSGRSVLPAKVKHTFDHKDRFIPEVMDVNGRRNRRLICLLGKDLRHYKVFDLDPLEGPRAEDDKMDMTGDDMFEDGTERYDEETEEDSNEVEAFPEHVCRPVYDEITADWAA